MFKERATNYKDRWGISTSEKFCKKGKLSSKFHCNSLPKFWHTKTEAKINELHWLNKQIKYSESKGSQYHPPGFRILISLKLILLVLLQSQNFYLENSCSVPPPALKLWYRPLSPLGMWRACRFHSRLLPATSLCHSEVGKADRGNETEIIQKWFQEFTGACSYNPKAELQIRGEKLNC